MDLSNALAQFAAMRAIIPDDVIKTGCDLLGKLLGRPCQVFGELLADEVYFFQWNNRLRILAKAARRLKGMKVDPRTMPPGFLIPLLDACGNTTDENLQDMWSELLAKAVESEDARHPLFIDALRRMSPKDAEVFQMICTGNAIGEAWSNDLLTGITVQESYAVGIGRGAEWRVPRGRKDLVPPVNHLVALGLVVVTGLAQYEQDADRFPLVDITAFGAEFFRAVSLSSADGVAPTSN